jgi:hypothetical protein
MQTGLAILVLSARILFSYSPTENWPSLNCCPKQSLSRSTPTDERKDSWRRHSEKADNTGQTLLKNRTISVDEPTIQSETDRYVAWPTQALAYKLGQLKFRELRDRARKKLGPKFDIRSFHDQMLSGGVLPRDLLEFLP